MRSVGYPSFFGNIVVLRKINMGFNLRHFGSAVSFRLDFINNFMRLKQLLQTQLWYRNPYLPFLQCGNSIYLLSCKYWFFKSENDVELIRDHATALVSNTHAPKASSCPSLPETLLFGLEYCLHGKVVC